MSSIQEERRASLREQIDWYLDRIKDEKILAKILLLINRLFVGKRV